jgi:IS30 family transposase
MTDQTKKPTKKPKPMNRKYDRKNVIALRKQGLSCTDIAKIEGTSISTITRYLKSVAPQLQTITHYNAVKADTLSLSQLKLQAISDILVSAWLANPEHLLNQDLRLQKEILVAVHGAKTYDHTAERLERNQATTITDYRALVVEMSGAELGALKKMKEIEDEIGQAKTVDA